MADYNINAVTRRVVYSGSAGTGPYAFSFEVLVSSDIVVYFNSTSLTLTTDYTVTINANGTGSVTIVTGTNVPTTPDANDTIIIVGARDIERTTDFVTAGDLLAASLNEQLDGLTIFDQQIAEEQKRSLMAPVYDPAHVDDGGTLDMTLPAKADRLGKSLVFNATTGNPEAGPTSTDIANAQTNATAAAASAVAAAASETAAGVSEAAAASYASPVTETFADTVGFTAGTSTTITLAATVVEDAVIITFDGVTQHHDTYSISGTTVTFTSTIPVGVLAIEASYGTRSTGAIDNIIIGANTPAAATVTTLTASGDVYTTAKMGVVAAPDALGAPLQVKHSGTVAYLGLDGGNSDTDPVLSTWTDPDPASALFGWSIYNSGSDGAFELFRRNNSTTEIEVASFSRSDGGLTLAGTLSAGATDVTTLTASGDAVVDNLGTGGISPVRDLHVSNAGTNVFAQWTNNTTGHTTTDGWLSGMPNGTDFRYYGYEVGGVFTFYPEETLSLTVAKLGVTVAGTLSAGATDVTTLTATGTISQDATATGDIAYFKTTGNSGTGLFINSNTTSQIDLVGWDGSDANAINLRSGGSPGNGILLDTSNNVTLSGTLSAGATTVTTLTASSEVFANSATNTGADGLVGFHTQDATAPGITMHNTGASGIHWGMYADASGNLQLRNNDTDTNVVTVGSSGTLSAGATTVTTLTASGDVAINTDTLLVDVSTETIGVKMTPDVLGAPLQIKHDGTVAYLGLDGGNSDTDPFLSTWQDPDPASALFGWSFFNRSTDGNLRLSRRNNSTTDTEVLTIARSTGNATFAGTADIANGVYIGGSVAANLLDDYEEGTWTPAISGDGTAGTYTNGTTQATYTKIGRMVTVNFGIGSFSTATGGTGNLRITGLPFTKTAGQSPTGSVWFSSVNTGASVISLALVFSTAAGASATLNVNEVVDNAVVQLTPISGVGVSSQIHGSITYFV
jgi:hypothetical protein